MHITLRVPQELLKAIDENAGKEAITRSRWIKQTLRNAIPGRTFDTPIEAEIGAAQELIEAEFATLRQSRTHFPGVKIALSESASRSSPSFSRLATCLKLPNSCSSFFLFGSQSESPYQ